MMKEILNEWKKFLVQEAKKPKAPPTPQKKTKPAKTTGILSNSYSPNLIQFLKDEEKFSDVPYQNKGDRPTIGYGTTFYIINGKEVPVTLKDKPITPEEGERLMLNYLNKKVMPSLNKYLKNKPMTQNQIDALVSVMYNMGNKGFLDTQLFTKASLNPNSPEISKLFMSDKIATVGGQVSQGLKNRRKRELELYVSPEGIDYKLQQSVAPQVPANIVQTQTQPVFQQLKDEEPRYRVGSVFSRY